MMFVTACSDFDCILIDRILDKTNMPLINAGSISLFANGYLSAMIENFPNENISVFVLTDENYKKLIDWQLLPQLSLLYFDGKKWKFGH